MSESLSLLKNARSIKVAKDYLGSEVPWEVKSYTEDYLAIETVGGIFDLTSWGAISLEGPDALDYLHRMTTVNFKTLAVGMVSYGAFLTGRGTLVSLGIFLREETKVVFIVPENQRQDAIDHIEKFHFAESFETKDISETSALFAWYNPRPEIFTELLLPANLAEGKIEWRRWKNMDLEIWKDPARPKLFFFRTDKKFAELFLREAERGAVPLVGMRVFDHLRIRHAVPEKGIELTDKEIILESGFDMSVHRNKGCYPGQEVVERIFTYGSVNRKLFPVELKFLSTEEPAFPLEVTKDGKRVGSLVSATQDPKNPQKGWGLFYLQKEFWTEDQVFSVSGVEVYYRPIK